MKTLLLTAAAALALSPAAFAKGKSGTAQNHHCELNGSTVVKTRKACKKAGGTWAKGAASDASSTTTPPPATTTK